MIGKKHTTARAPVYPEDSWEFLWFRYTQDNKNPWGDIINKSSKTELNFDFNWGEGIVNKSGLSNNVGFVASRTIRITDAGEYTFLIGGDDGIRLQVINDQFNTVLTFNEWNDQTYSLFEKTIGLPAGEYKLLLEWYEHYVTAHVSFDIRQNKFNVLWHLSGDVMRVPPYGSMDIPSSDSASKLTVQQLQDEGNVKIRCDMKGLRPLTRYRLAISKWYSRGSDRYPGIFSNTLSPLSFVTAEDGCALKEINLQPKDFPNPGIHTLSMWLNNEEPMRTILISDNFEVRVPDS